MTTDDLKSLMLIQSLCYEPALHEPQQAFATKLTAARDASWLALMGQQPAAYLITLPLQADGPPQLPALSETTAQQVVTRPNWLYVHDMAVNPGYRGAGLGALLFEQAMEYAKAHRITNMALVAVQRSAPYWQALGFATDGEPQAHIANKLRTFGDDAIFMTRSVTP